MTMYTYTVTILVIVETPLQSDRFIEIKIGEIVTILVLVETPLQ